MFFFLFFGVVFHKTIPHKDMSLVFLHFSRLKGL